MCVYISTFVNDVASTLLIDLTHQASDTSFFVV